MSKGLTIWDRKSSKLMVTPKARRWWLGAAAFLIPIARIVGRKVGLQDLSDIITLIFGVPVLVYAFWPRRSAGVGKDAVSDKVRTLLEIICAFAAAGLKDAAPYELRVTLFLPNKETLTLHQVARHCYDKRTNLSDTVIRMGTGMVGLAFTRDAEALLEDVQTYGGFLPALRRFGIEPIEAEKHDERRRSFLALPLDDPFGELPEPRLGALAIDAVKPMHKEHRDAILEKIDPLIITLRRELFACALRRD